MSDLTHLTIKQALDGLDNKDFTARELTQAHITAMERDRHLNAYITETPEHALQAADAIDQRRANGEHGGLDGIPLAIKDLFCTHGITTTAGSHILDNFVPPYESTVTHQLKQAGAICLGKTNLDEFAMGSANTTSYFGACVNPWKANSDDESRVPGGSSGGSASAVAGRLALGATGTDTGGSIRQPASFCGIVGMKPTYGRCSRFGIVAFASSLDQAGPMTRTVEDAAIMLNTMSGHDTNDATSSSRNVPDFTQALGQNVKGLKIGVPKEYRVDGMPDDVEQLWQKGIAWLREEGADIVDISLPHTRYGLPAYYIIAPAEASANLARYDGVRYGLRVEGDDLKETYRKTRAEGFGDEVKRRIMIGTYVLSAGYYDAYYLKAQKVRNKIIEDFDQAYAQVDAILTPTTPSAAFPIGANEDDPVTMYLNDVFTVGVNLAGLPGISVPAGTDSNGLPLGLQVIAPKWDEATALRVGSMIEAKAEFTSLPQTVEKAA
jgi:aspartyl-tRNA(Asn)/glutamyl-tRNA(Gln) amidotransferase subunit A